MQQNLHLLFQQPFFDHYSKFVFLFDVKNSENFNMLNIGIVMKFFRMDNYIAIKYDSSSKLYHYFAVTINMYSKKYNTLDTNTTFEDMFPDKLKNISGYQLRISMRHL